jgi:hypothetical protein
MAVIAAGRETKLGALGRWQTFWLLPTLLHRFKVGSAAPVVSFDDEMTAKIRRTLSWEPPVATC